MKKIYIYKTVVILFIFVLATNKIFAQPAGWSHSQVYSVTEHSGALVTDYQLKITLNTQSIITAGQMNANGSDIRFGKDNAGTVMYNYWIESGINTATTTIWVKIDTLFASATRSVYFFYGNAAAPATSAVAGTFVGPMSSTDSVKTGGAGGSTDSQRGFKFSTTEDLLVTHFGKNEPDGTPRYVTLFNFTTQAIISQIQVTGPAAQYNYNLLASPLWLISGTPYLIELFQGPTDGYYFGLSTQAGQQIVYGDMYYCNGCTQNTFPASMLTGYHYGYPDFWYWRKKNVTPAPTYTVSFTGINSNAFDSSISISPNPSNGLFYVTLEKKARVAVYNNVGQLVFDKEMNAGKSELNLSGYANGMYLLKATEGNKQFNFQMIKE